jgi:hypothetical protein
VGVGVNNVSQQPYDYVKLSEIQASGTPPGIASTNAWHPRVLNTVEIDTAGICTLSSNQFTLPAGTYDISAISPFVQVASVQIRLYNVTNSTVAIIGETGFSDPTFIGSTPASASDISLRGRVTITGSSTFELQYYCVASGGNTYELGNYIAATGLATTFSVVEIRRIRDAESPSLQQDNFPKNILHNGAQDLSQRYGSSATSPQACAVNSRTFIVDRWGILPNGAGITAQQVTNVPSSRSRYSLQLNGASSVTTVAIEQDIESSDATLRCRRMLTFSAWVYCSGQGSSVTPIFRVRTPSVSDDYTTNTVVLSQSAQLVPVGVWTQVVVNFDPSILSNISNGMRIGLQFPSGALSSGSYSILISQCQLESGARPTSFQGLARSMELEQCIRFYESIISENGTTLISSLLVGNASSTYWWFKALKIRTPIFSITGTWSNQTPTVVPTLEKIRFYNNYGYFYITSTIGEIAASADSEDYNI